MQVLRHAFKQQLDPAVSEFVGCIEDDRELIDVDIKGSLSHAEMLAKIGLLSQQQFDNIKAGLLELRKQYALGHIVLKSEWEDVHMNVEQQLKSAIGADALRLHTARSRNDQVAIDMRLYTIDETNCTRQLLNKLQIALLTFAQKHSDVVIPGYTHLQRAQPLLLAHILHAFAEMFARDESRFADSLKRTAVSPLGAGALAGSSLPIDPSASAVAAGLPAVFANSVDAVSDRDFVVEFIAAAAMTAVHLSQLAETFVLWSTSEFNFISFTDAVTTASSLMPNKKNPDPLELIRGKSGRIIGELVSALTTLKALPIGYNRDLQETKPPLIHVAKTLKASIEVMIRVLSHAAPNSAAMLVAASDPYMCATDLVEYLVNKSVPFRQAHETVTALVSYCRDGNLALPDLSLAEFKQFAVEFENDVFALFEPLTSVNAKSSPGGTGCVQVALAIETALKRLSSHFQDGMGT